MRLFHHALAGVDASQRKLLLLHGLFGSGGNFRTFARGLAEHHSVLAADLRNHGESPHGLPMDYPTMVRDVAALIDHVCDERIDLFGHSMGGKVAMSLALREPSRVNRLIVLDIAPVAYGSTDTFCRYVDGMRALPLADVRARREADSALKASVPDPRVRAFLLHNLRREENGRYSWRINLDALAQHMMDIAGFPDQDAVPFQGPTLFVRGAQSDYVLPEHTTRIRTLFPAAEIVTIPDAGHWVHAEQPKALQRAIQAFFAANAIG